MAEWFEDESFWAETYPFMFPEERFGAADEQVENALALANIQEGAVLDLCCGPGRHAAALAKRGLRVVAVDRTRFLLDKAKQRAGFNEIKLYGDLDGKEYGLNASRLVAVVRKG